MTANHDPSDQRAQQPRSDRDPYRQSQGHPAGGSQQPGSPQRHPSAGQPRPQQSAPSGAGGRPPQGSGQHGAPPQGAPQQTTRGRNPSRQAGGPSQQPARGSPPGGQRGPTQQGQAPVGGTGASGAGPTQSGQPGQQSRHPQGARPQQQPGGPRGRRGRGHPGRPLLQPITLEEIVADDVVTADRDTPIRTVVAQMAENDVGSAVVIDDGEPVGVVTDRKVALALEESPDVSGVTVDDLLDGDLVTADTSMTVFDVLERMSEHGIRRLPVTDDENNLQGIVSLDDVVVLLGTELGNVAETIRSQIDRL